MKNLSLIINIVSYLLLFAVLFIKVTDSNKRTLCQKIIVFTAMMWSLFLTIYLTETYLYNLDKPLNVRLNIYEIITKILITAYLITKIKDDKIFKKK